MGHVSPAALGKYFNLNQHSDTRTKIWGMCPITLGNNFTLHARSDTLTKIWDMFPLAFSARILPYMHRVTHAPKSWTCVSCRSRQEEESLNAHSDTRTTNIGHVSPATLDYDFTLNAHSDTRTKIWDVSPAAVGNNFTLNAPSDTRTTIWDMCPLPLSARISL